MKSINCVFPLLFAGFGFLSCEQKDELLKGRVDLYLLESFATIDNYCQIDESTIVLESSPFIDYEDLLSYNAGTHSFRLSNHGKEAIVDKGPSLHGQAFAVMANGELIFTGFFWASFSSASCQWITTDPIRMNWSDELEINLGYPGQFEDFFIPDNRNDSRLMAIFRMDKKLIN